MQELLVRGYLYQMLKQKHNIVAATIVTTALFTALHGGVCKIEGSILVLFVNVTLIVLFMFLKNKHRTKYTLCRC